MVNGLGGLALLAAVAVGAYAAIRIVLLPLVRKAAQKTDVRWDDILTDRQVLNRIAWLAPLVVARVGLDIVLDEPDLERWLDLSGRVLDAAANSRTTEAARTGGIPAAQDEDDEQWIENGASRRTSSRPTGSAPAVWVSRRRR